MKRRFRKSSEVRGRLRFSGLTRGDLKRDFNKAVFIRAKDDVVRCVSGNRSTTYLASSRWNPETTVSPTFAGCGSSSR